MEKYYIIESGKQKGPYTLRKIIKMKLPENTLVWKSGLKEWIPIVDLKEYKDNVPPPVPKFVLPATPIIEQPTSNNLDLSNKDLDVQTVGVNSFCTPENLKGLITPKPHAGFVLRLLAFIIDFLLMFLITTFIWAIFQIPIPENSKVLFSGKFYLFKSPLSILFGWLFYSLFESSKFKATPGKILIGLIVTDNNYNRIDFGTASGRFFGKILSGLILGIGYFMIGWTKNKQGLHDVLANTFVVKESVANQKRRKIGLISLVVSFILFIISLFIPGNTSLLDLGLKKPKNNFHLKQAGPEDFVEDINSLDDKKRDQLLNQFEVIKKNQIHFFEGFSVNYPADWLIKKENRTDDGLAYVINFEKADNQSIGSIVIWLFYEERNLEAVMEDFKKLLKKDEVYTYAIFSENVQMGRSGILMNKSNFKNSIHNVGFSGEIISLILNKNTFLFTLVSPDDNLKENEKDFQFILNSLRKNSTINNLPVVTLNEKNAKIFFDSLKSNPHLKGIPEDFENFKPVFSDTNKLEILFNSLKANPNVTFLPTTYKEFLAWLKQN